jgi:hypothetical protein
MTEIGEPAVETRAKELCAADGHAWDDGVRPIERWTQLALSIGEAGRAAYRARAREQLLNERVRKREHERDD